MKDERECIYVMDEDKMWNKVFLEEIYYIETIKSTHYCEVVFNGGRGKLRADITPLYEKLKGYLYRTRASTLANLCLVKRVDTQSRILYFEKNCHCTYTERVSKELKERLNICSYRSSGGDVE